MNVMNNKEHYKKANSFEEHIHNVRGIFINGVTEIENYITYVIAKHFSQGNSNIYEEMMLFVLDSLTMSLHNKKNLFQQIVEKNYLHFVKSYKDYEKDLSDIISKRNLFAHSPIEVGKNAEENYKNDIINFIKYKNKLDKVSFTSPYLITLLIKCMIAEIKFMILQKHFKK